MRLGAGEVYLGEVAKCRHQTAAVPGAGRHDDVAWCDAYQRDGGDVGAQDLVKHGRDGNCLPGRDEGPPVVEGVEERAVRSTSGRGAMRQRAFQVGAQSCNLGMGSSAMVTDCLAARRWSRVATAAQCQQSNPVEAAVDYRGVTEPLRPARPRTSSTAATAVSATICIPPMTGLADSGSANSSTRATLANA